MFYWPISFQDLDCRHTFACCRARSGEVVIKWVPFGMPRLKSSLAQAVFYLFAQNPHTGALEGPLGTGLFVSRPASERGMPHHIYAVTAHHVMQGPGASIIRLNTFEGENFEGEPQPQVKTRPLEFEPHEWQFIGGADDLAAIDVTDALRSLPRDLIRPVEERDFVTIDFINRMDLGVGEDGFMLGLFESNPGERFNYPAARFGNLSQLASWADLLEQGNGVPRPSHVFDMHSRPGYSGSPVFVYRTIGGDLTAIDEVGGNFVLDLNESNTFLRLLGIHSGQFDQGIRLDGKKLIVPSSMTIIIPAFRITELLNIEAFEMQRKAREERLARRARVRPESVERKSGKADLNPDHKEDFKSLLGAAATKKPQAD